MAADALRIRVLLRVTPIPTVRSFIAGNSGSGKTTLAWRLYLSQMPRYIVIDQLGEWNDKVDITTDTLPELVAAIRELAPRGRWSVSYSLADDRYEDLVMWLIPLPDAQASPIIAVGGAALLNDEIDLIAPFGPPPSHIRTLYRRSRHVGLSVISLTSVPANVSKEVTRQSTHRIALFLDEPSDVRYMADAMRWTPEAQAQWEAWTRRYPHGAEFREVLTGRRLLLTGQGQTVDATTTQPEPDLPEPQPQPEPQRQQAERLPEPESLSSGLDDDDDEPDVMSGTETANPDGA